MLEDMRDKREVWHVDGSKTILEASKERELVVALVPTSAVKCAWRWHVERHNQLEVSISPKLLVGVAGVMPASWPLTRECLSVFHGSPIVTTGHLAMC